MPDQRQLGSAELRVYGQAAPQWVTCTTVEEICPCRPACDPLRLERQLCLLNLLFPPPKKKKKIGFPPVLWMPLFSPLRALSLLSSSNLLHSLLDCASMKYFHPKGDLKKKQVPFKRDLKRELPPRL